MAVDTATSNKRAIYAIRIDLWRDDLHPAELVSPEQ